jgi:nitrite reductase/ring-hydroxylating ferredoxin subunit
VTAESTGRRGSSRRYVVGRASDLAEGERMIVTVNNRSIGIFNIDGRFHGLPNLCPHKGAEMCRGLVLADLTSEGPGDYTYDTGKRYVACPWHGWEFDVETGQSYFDPARTRMRTYSVEVEDGSMTLGDVSEGRVNVTPEQYYLMTQKGFDLTEDLPTSPEGERIPGPYSVETIEVRVEDDYLVVDLAPARPTRERA